MITMDKQAINTRIRKVPTWPLYAAAPLPIAWLYYRGLTGGLGVDPVKAIEHQLGLWALQLLIVGLAITPLRRHLGINLLKFRRVTGLSAFLYVVAHLLTWLALDIQFLWDQIGRDILKRPYITIGMSGFALMLPLAATSYNGAIRRMGAAAWGRLHKLTYPVVVLGGVHYLMVVKGWQIEPMIYLAVITLLLGLRLRPRNGRMARNPA